LEVSRSAYYAHRAGPSWHDQQDAGLTEQIITVHEESGGTYGAPRVHAELRDQGRRHSRKRIARLMRAAGRRGRAPRRWRTTTIPDPVAAAACPDLVSRDFTVGPDQVNTRWCGDITYINTWEGWLYLATVIDLASRRVVGWATADHLRTDLVAQALSNAVATRRPTDPVIFHSDRGCQYVSAQYARLAQRLGVRLSVGRKGQCWDNARTWVTLRRVLVELTAAFCLPASGKAQVPGAMCRVRRQPESSRATISAACGTVNAAATASATGFSPARCCRGPRR
jgi:transposase InsO family protein